MHWVSAQQALTADIRIYDRLFVDPNPEAGDFIDNLNPDSLKVLNGCKLEPSLTNAKPGTTFQFMRKGFFCVDSEDSKPNEMVFNQTIALRETWRKKK